MPFVSLPMHVASQRPLLASYPVPQVYLASLHETPVAVKILMKLEDSAGGKEEPATLSDPALAELYKETELLCTMRHPNVVQLMG